MATNYRGYWENFYESHAAPEEASQFADYVAQIYTQPGQALIELGCGNGRDAHFFASQGVDVLAVDQCASEIDTLIATNGRYDNLHFAAADFTDMPDASDGNFNMVYSRFTLHSVSAEGQTKTLQWSHRNLAPGGFLCIETRGQQNELYGLGEPVDGEPDAYIYDEHYRRFVSLDTLRAEVEATGFNIVEASEDTGYAPYQDTDYHFIRLIAQKPETL